MNIIKYFCQSNISRTLFGFIFLSLLSVQSMAANYPLEIIQPQAGLDTKNRFYKAYPGFEYNVRLAVIGGVFPFRYELITAPEGMTIDNKGEITWANPLQSATPYNVKVVVKDAQSGETDVSWTVLVTTNGFRFIDAVNGTAGGTGLIDNPWKSMKGMYGGDVLASKNTSTYAGEFVYWRNGTYVMDAYKEDGGTRVPFVGNNKPQVWLAYPGESPVLDLAAAQLIFYGGGTDTYIDGLEIDVNGNSKNMGIQIDSGANRVTIRRSTLHGITNAATGGNNSLLFISRDRVGSYWSIQDNEFYDVGADPGENGYGILGYWASRLLIEDNVLHNISQHPIGPKEGTAMWFIRGNHMYNNRTNSISLQYSEHSNNGDPVRSGDIEISFNVVEADGGKVTINSNLTPTGAPMYIFRNTFLDEALQNKVTATNGKFAWTDNVIVNETSFTDKLELYQIDNPSNLVVSNNLTGSAANNIVDSQGFLTTNYFAFVGSRGHQLDNKRPLPPIIK